MKNSFTTSLNIEFPIICGAMYPCSNPELVAAASEAGGIGVIQPLSLVFVHKYDFLAGLKKIQSLTQKPVGMNVIVEKSSKIYEDRMKKWVDVAIENGVRFFVTSLGNPKWVVEKVHAAGGTVYHDITERKWAIKAKEAGVDGLICVNNRAGGHVGTRSAQELFKLLQDLNLPLIAAGGVGNAAEMKELLDMGYLGVQLGTRFIATQECKVHEDYKKAIVSAQEQDIVWTEKISGVPVSVIETPWVRKIGTRAGPIAKYMLKHRKLKHYMRLLYSLKGAWQLSQASQKGKGYQDFFQAGKSVQNINSIPTVAEVMSDFSRSC